MYEGLTVNADLPEQFFSLTDTINENQLNNNSREKNIIKLLGKSKQMQFKEKT